MSDHTKQRHADEARERWGHTDAYRQSAARTTSYSESVWAEIKAELESIKSDFADAMVQGIDPDADAARALAERARLHIDRRYYACSHEMHSALADMYTADDRFRAHYDDRVDGLAEYVAAAIKANAARHT